MAVLIILIHLDLKGFRLYASLRTDRFGLRLLLREKGVHPQLAKLQIGLHTEKCRTAIDQAIAGVHAHVTCLQRLDNLIFLTGIGQLELLRVEIE